MPLFDHLRTSGKANRELQELRDLYARLQQYAGEAGERRDELVSSVLAGVFHIPPGEALPPVALSAWTLCHALLGAEGYLYIPAIDTKKTFTMVETWELTATIKRALVPFE